jgi:4-hydroxy-tetrahydrodipicolinate synthase
MHTKNHMISFEGIWVPLVTPFHHQEVDLPCIKKLARAFCDAGVHGLVVCGTTGEAAMLEEGEKAQILAAVQEVVPQDFPVVMGISGSDTRTTVEKLICLEQFGMPPSAYLISPPAYVRPSQEGIRLHYEKILAATAQPVILYNIPARTGVNMEPETIKLLAQHPQVMAIKDCGGKFVESARLLKQTELSVFCGDDAMLFDFFIIGAHGAISAAAHLRPDLFVHLFQLSKQGKTADALILFRQLFPIIRLLFSEPNPAPVKAALSLLGVLEEELRLPMTPMSHEGKRELANELDKLMNIPKPVVTSLPSFLSRHSLLVS